jgi:predicted phage terminase large subunit-like protein
MSNEILLGLPSEDELIAALCERRFYDFFREFWETIEATELILNWHIEFICDQLQEVYEAWARGEQQPDVLINVPPGSSKSTIVTQLFAAWLWVKNPSIRIISSSYAADLSISHAVKTRDCLKSEKFAKVFPGRIEFKHDEDGKTAYKNTKKGQRFTTSTGGRVTGMHGDFILVDDPINPEESESETTRIRANRFVSKTLSTRKTNKKRTVTIMVMQRLHELDPAGTWIATKPTLRHICLPGELSSDIRPAEAAKYYVDGLLDPNRLDIQACTRLKEDLGSYGYAGQIQQRPSPEGGGKLKKVWFHKLSWPDFLEFTKGERVVWNFDADTAFTKDQVNDPTGVMASAYVRNLLFIRQVDWVRLEMGPLCRFLPQFVERNGYTAESKLAIEPKANGKSTVQTLRESTKLNVIEAPAPTDDKVTRANSIVPFCESLRVVLIDGSWCDRWLDEVSTFPNAAHDESVDLLVQAVQRILPGVKPFEVQLL